MIEYGKDCSNIETFKSNHWEIDRFKVQFTILGDK